MCTVTIVGLNGRERAGVVKGAETLREPHGLRLACSQDELKTRPAAKPPEA
jgi:hypothetical protein